jgi:hypothetical protein
MCALAADARADKKKAGLFDIDWWKPPVKHEHNAAQRLAPQGLNPPGGAGPRAGGRPIRLRIYADKDYRAVVIRWQSKARVQIQRINAVVGSVFDAHFEIESMRDWDRSHVGVPLGGPLIDELEALDDGKDVDLVVGLVTPLHGVATSVHSIGWAAYLSRHFLLRGMDDEQEFQAFEREFKLISVEERQRLYADRKAHKEIVCFLHEWGHTLGLIHHEDRKLVMNPAYDPLQTEFSEHDRRIVELVLERRFETRDELFPESAALVPLLEAMPAGEGSEGERAHVLDLVRHRAAHRSSTKQGGANTVDLPAADIEAFNKAVSTLNAGRAEDAWKLLAPVVEHAAARTVGGNTWLRIAELAAAMGALTRADEAAGRAGKLPGAQKISAELESTRHRIALPLDAAKLGVPPEREPAYFVGYWQAARLIDEDNVAAARARLGELAASFPGAPGLAVLSCDLELRAKHVALATKHCEEALVKFKGATRAHVLLAAIAFRSRKEAVGEQHLRQAILLDPADPTAWRLMAQFYRSTHASKRLADLANEHQALLSSPLPE